MRPFDACPVCGGETVARTVEKIVRGGQHTAVLHVPAEVCLHCGERLYGPETIRRFEDVRGKLERQDVGEFELLGRSYQVA